MKHGYIKITAASFPVKLADPRANALSVIASLNEANAAGANILVLPELSLTGASCGDLFFQNILINEAKDALAKIRDASKNVDTLLFVGAPVMIRRKLYNCALAVSRGNIIAIIPKTNLTEDARWFSPAPEKTEFVDFCGFGVPFGTDIICKCRELDAFTVSAELSDDLLSHFPPSQRHSAAGANLIVNLSALPETVSSEEYVRTSVIAHSARTLSAYAYCSAGEGESTTDTVNSGYALITENGRVLAENPPFASASISVSADLLHVASDRMKRHSFPKDADNGYVTVSFSSNLRETDITGAIDPAPFIPKSESEMKKVCRRILDIQSHGLAARLKAAHSKSAVVGISGGLDSCLALLVTARAFDILSMPRENIISVTMPCFGTTSRTKSNAEILSRELKTSFREINIAAAVRRHFEDIGHSESDFSVVYENSQARERTQVIMDIANQTGGLVVGTGDLSELALGWATYNGDHMSNYGVNAGIPKTLIRYVVAYESALCREAGKTLLADSIDDILNTPVSPELLPAKDGDISQKTEDIVGPYELHDFFLYRLVRFGDEPEKILRTAKSAFAGIFDDAVIEKWLNIFLGRFFRQQFKRSCLPDGPKVGSVSFSPRGDFKMPSDALSNIWNNNVK